MEIQHAKAKMRQLWKILVDLPEHFIEEQSMLITRSFNILSEFKQSKTISVYLSMPHGEINTSNIIKESRRMGKKIYVPFIDGSNMHMLQLLDSEDPFMFARNKWGIPEPDRYDANGIMREEAMKNQGLDLILVPGVAFDRNLNRLGHGKGYYDTYFARMEDWCRKHHLHMPLKVGLALKEQLVDAVPVDSSDVKLDILLVGDEVIRSVL
ncbi:5-formyltetrahydrofolate cyclo-ligase [Pneumocystis jirovecii RU7]|uniref:5-formyltetrahydrofolate cyclo-ligase n=1 Tax=Pneumocystis jirovecii (strain RU7) TaxID=1408657 RepID=A0A0W4ZNP0_PNEJ7|nr:5-formyltetrahydrofolate cyclo-ligase [Pneumocystis jirovecii RU7]KTW29982.1 5-formyltetrahydrofolate cyclo-ligase [Pneumocystis jirovecii RU7]